MSRAHLACLGAVLLAVLLSPRAAAGYSVLAHEATVDALWDPVIAPLLRERYPGMTPEGVRRARAYAYGGAVIQDLGYYPFGSRLFTNLVHYVRSGDFVEALIGEARNVDEYAFALGALAHYAADNAGHPLAINRAVPLIYPKLRRKHGDTVTYAESPKRHIMVEFAFDVVHAAAGAYLPDAYQDFVGFEVATPVLERAFVATYGLEMKDLFSDLDLAVGTYRYAVSTLIPEITKVAWREKRQEIERLTPGVQRDAFIHRFTRRHYEERFGTHYRRPGILTRFLGLLFKLLPKVGPLRALGFEAPTPEAERLFAESFVAARERYRRSLRAVATGTLRLPNTDFDTGAPTRHGENELADETFADLLSKLASRNFAGTPLALRSSIRRFYAGYSDPQPASRKARKRAKKLKEALSVLQAAEHSAR
jgi:hypothetical protein